MHTKKVCLLGDFSVGKTSLIRRYVHDEFSLDYRATVGVQIHRHEDKLETREGTVPFAQVIWDIEGSRFGEDLVTNYIMGSSGAVIVGDTTRRNALESMISHAHIFLAVLPGRPIVFALNKSDLITGYEHQDVDKIARTIGGELIYTSALNGDGVRKLFLKLGMLML